MTKTVSFVTPRGAKIDLQLVTETPNLADHTVINATWEMRVIANGDWLTYGWFGLVDSADAGRCIKVGNTLIQVPAEALSEVEALVGEYNSVRDRRTAAADAADAAYEAHFEAVSAMVHNEGGV